MASEANRLRQLTRAYQHWCLVEDELTGLEVLGGDQIPAKHIVAFNLKFRTNRESNL